MSAPFALRFSLGEKGGDGLRMIDGRAADVLITGFHAQHPSETEFRRRPWQIPRPGQGDGGAAARFSPIARPRFRPIVRHDARDEGPVVRRLSEKQFAQQDERAGPPTDRIDEAIGGAAPERALCYEGLRSRSTPIMSELSTARTGPGLPGKGDRSDRPLCPKERLQKPGAIFGVIAFRRTGR